MRLPVKPVPCGRVLAARKPTPARRFNPADHPRDTQGQFAALGMRTVKGPDGLYDHSGVWHRPKPPRPGVKIPEGWSASNPVSRDEAIAYLRNGGAPDDDIKSRFEIWRSRGWRSNGKPIDEAALRSTLRSIQTARWIRPTKTERKAELPRTGGRVTRDRLSMKYRPDDTQVIEVDEETGKTRGDTDEARRLRTAARRRGRPKKPTS